MSARLALGLLFCLTAGFPALALDDVQPSACGAATPAEGVSFSGPVLQVIDGERLCVATGPRPEDWIEVRPLGLRPAAALPATQARALLMSATFSRRLDCVAGQRIGEAVAAVCTVEGAALPAQMQAARARPGWTEWR